MLALLLVAQVASQPIIIRDPFQPTVETRLSSGCDEQSLELRWTVLEGQEAQFDEISTNGALLPSSEIEALNCWKGERTIEGVDVICHPDGEGLRTRLRVEFDGGERLGLPNLESFEIAGNHLVFDRSREAR